MDIIFGCLSAADRLRFKETCTRFSVRYISPLLYPKQIRQGSPPRSLRSPELLQKSPAVDHGRKTKSPKKTASDDSEITAGDQRNRGKIRFRLNHLYQNLRVACLKLRPQKHRRLPDTSTISTASPPKVHRASPPKVHRRERKKRTRTEKPKAPKLKPKPKPAPSAEQPRPVPTSSFTSRPTTCRHRCSSDYGATIFDDSAIMLNPMATFNPAFMF